MDKVRSETSRAFTLVELLVVIGIISVLIGLLLPALSQAKLKGQAVKCLSNLQQIGLQMEMYCNDNRGLLIPIGPLEDGTQNISMLTSAASPGAVGDGPGGTAPYEYMTLGSEVYPWMRWPALLIKSNSYAAIPAQAQWSNYIVGEPSPGDPDGLTAAPWTPPMMVCPSDPQPGAAHSYLFNQHLVQNQTKVLTYSAKPPSGKDNGTVVVLGEKRSIKDDYYMEQGDFPIDPTTASQTHVELYRHGVKLGSNYLYKDFHAQNQPPAALSDEVDPWDITPVQTTSSN